MALNENLHDYENERGTMLFQTINNEGSEIMLKRPGKMRLFKSRKPNLVHYVTAVTFNRVPVFRSEHACSLLIEALASTREKERSS
ncbi:MAG: hypothetical protein ABR501_01600 [Pyrinomonadaceae bacterium]